MSKTLYMMVGIAGSGKDTFISNNFISADYLASSDDIIESYAVLHGSDYKEMWKYLADAAQKMVNSLVKFHIDKGNDIVWNQTNLTEKSRYAKLQLFPADWKKIAVYVHTPYRPELNHRLALREEATGKHIPVDVIDNMIKQLQPPIFAEGFDEIWQVIEGRVVKGYKNG